MQLARYFGVEGGTLIDEIRENSPASKAGLKAGDVIVEVEGVSAKGPLTVIQNIIDKNAIEVTFTIVRDRKRISVPVALEKVVASVLEKP